jgi:hypothetical protein
MFGDAIEGKVELARDLKDRGALLRKLRQDRSTNRVRQGVKGRIQALVCGSANHSGTHHRTLALGFGGGAALMRRVLGYSSYRS